jgi:hypothetical protein
MSSHDQHRARRQAGNSARNSARNSAWNTDWNGQWNNNWNGNWRGNWQGRGWGAAAWSQAWEDPRQSQAEPSHDGRRDTPRKQVRIGDAERDQAVSALSEHFVAGRLTQAEFEERSEQATKARYADELEPLFDDLPASTQLQPVPAGPASLRRRPGPPPAFLMLAPFLMIGLVVSSIALTAPWLLWGVFWIVIISSMTRRRHHYHR